MDLSKDISAAELQFREKLEYYLISIFKDTIIDSHGLAHHRRVWNHAKDLLLYPEIGNRIKDGSFPLKLLIGSYLHDSGMVRERGPRHGSFSRDCTLDFLAASNISAADNEDLLAAVENHDNKEYSLKQERSLLHEILSIADDLDALGYIGIYRYIEIYLMRDVKYHDLGNEIIRNVTGRFDNFRRTFAGIPKLIARYNPGFETIRGFFEKYNMQMTGYKFGSAFPAGYCAVAEIISNMIKNNLKLEDVIEDSLEDPDRVISWYFGELKREMNVDGAGNGMTVTF